MKKVFFIGLALIGYFIPAIAFAQQYPNSFNISCNANGAGICTTGGGPQTSVQVPGQAFTLNGSVTATNLHFRVDLCISTTQFGAGGICGLGFQTDGFGSVTIPNGDTTAYRWGRATVNITGGPTVVNGSFVVIGRSVSLDSVSDNPDPILPNQSSVISYSGKDAWSGSMTCTHPGGANCSVGSININSGNQTYINNGNIGTANYAINFTGPDASGNSTISSVAGNITIQNPPPTVDIKCNATNGPCTVLYGGNTTLSWTHAGSPAPIGCVTTGSNGFSQTGNSNAGISSGAITSSTTFTITCNGGVTDSVTVINPVGPTVNLRCATTSGGVYGNGPCSNIAKGAPGWLNWNITAGTATTCQTTTGVLWNPSGAKAISQAGPPGQSTLPMNIATDVLGLQCRNATTGTGWGPTDTVTLNRVSTAPAVSNITVTEPDYCSKSIGAAVVSWNYTDPDGDDQATYDLQVDNDPSDTVFSSPEIDKVAVPLTATSGTTPSVSIGVGLVWNTRYHARIRSTDISGLTSPWVRMSICVGPDCDPATPQRHWNTPVHKYPATVDINFAPASPVLNQAINFSTNATCFNNANSVIACSSWAWNFGDGATSTAVAPSHTYVANGAYSTTLQVTDNLAHTCPTPAAQQDFIFGTPPPVPTPSPIPSFREVIPH